MIIQAAAMIDGGWVRLGRAVQRRRARLGYSSAHEFAAAAGLSPATVEVIESGRHTGRPRETTLAKLEQALGWQDGSCLRVVEGGRARDVADPLLARVLAVWPLLSGEDQARVAAAVERLRGAP